MKSSGVCTPGQRRRMEEKKKEHVRDRQKYFWQRREGREDLTRAMILLPFLHFSSVWRRDNWLWLKPFTHSHNFAVQGRRRREQHSRKKKMKRKKKNDNKKKKKAPDIHIHSYIHRYLYTHMFIRERERQQWRAFVCFSLETERLQTIDWRQKSER